MAESVIKNTDFSTYLNVGSNLKMYMTSPSSERILIYFTPINANGIVEGTLRFDLRSDAFTFQKYINNAWVTLHSI